MAVGVVQKPKNEAKKLSDIVCCVVDQGLFVDFACKLAETYKKVYYHNPSVATQFPVMQVGEIGRGFKGITLVRSWEEVLDECDLCAFPDINHGALQQHLADLGKRVWGSRLAERLECDRVFAKKKLAELGLPVGDYVVITGVEDLREYLKAHRNCHIKISYYRGMFESFKSKNYAFSKMLVNKIAYKLGPLADHTEFIVEANLPGKIEVAVDAYCIDGVFPSQCMVGLEIKDLGYLGVFCDYEKIPEPITRFDRAIGPYMKENNYRGFYSAENRIGDDHVPYMIDPCLRAGSPPSELYQEMYTNLAEIVWKGAGGECVDPVCPAKFGAEIMIHASFAENDYQQIEFPEEYRRYIKLRNAIKVDGEYYIMPQPVGMPEVGAVIGWGDTIQEAFSEAREVAESIEGYTVEFHEGSLDKAEAELETAKDLGIDILKAKAA
jgi:hypothetical protein